MPWRPSIAPWRQKRRPGTLGQLGRREETIATCDDMLARFGTASELRLQEKVVRALMVKANALGVLRRSEERIAAYDEVLARFGTASELLLREGVARALVNKGIALNQLDRRKEATRRTTMCSRDLARRPNRLCVNRSPTRFITRESFSIGSVEERKRSRRSTSCSRSLARRSN
jgi:hypothetical protein